MLRFTPAVLLTASLALGGCMQATLSPSSDAAMTPRDKQLLAHAPYARASIPEQFQRHIVDYTRKEQPGSILVDTDARYLYYVLPQGKAIRYGVAVGEEAMAFSGVATVGRVAEWPDWVPTADIQARLGQPEYIGQAISSGCIRMTNTDVIDLFNRVNPGATVVVLPPGNATFAAFSSRRG